MLGVAPAGWQAGPAAGLGPAVDTAVAAFGKDPAAAMAKVDKALIAASSELRPGEAMGPGGRPRTW